MTALKPGEEIVFTTPAVDLIQMAGKYIFGGTGTDSGTKPDADDSNASSDASPTGQTPTP
jgi:phospholipid/cholesterol/gamma-HCH transport system substrate-binding protein